MPFRTCRLLFAMIVAALLLPLPGTAAGPDLRLRPDDGPPGASVTARGRNSAPGAAGEITWEGVDAPLASFTADDDGSFEVTITVPELPAGAYTVTATTGAESTDDRFQIEASDPANAVTTTPMPAWMAEASPVNTGFTAHCTGESAQTVPVTNAAELTAALAAAKPGDEIRLADGTYGGNFVAATDGTADAPIVLCGSREAVIDGGGWEQSGYALHITADHWIVAGITVTNAQKGVMLDGANHVTVTRLEVHTTGHEAIHVRTHSSDNLIAENDIHDTGLDNEKFGEGIYLGSAVSNWPRYTDGEPDRSDRNQVAGNRIWATSSESIDIKEGTEGGLIEGNLFDGSGMSGADSWVDVKGTGYVIRGNTGHSSPQDGFQTHVIDDMEWGTENIFEGNTAVVGADGVGFYIHQPETTANVVRCDNVVEDAGAFSNLDLECVG